MATNRPLIVTGHSGYLAVPIIAIPTITLGAFTHFRDTLPDFCLQNAEKVIAISTVLTLILAAVALFRRNRYVALRGELIEYGSWLTSKAVQASALSAVTFETEVAAGSDQTTVEHFLSLWAGHELAMRFNTSLWPRSGLATLVYRISSLNPSIRLDRAVDQYVASALPSVAQQQDAGDVPASRGRP